MRGIVIQINQIWERIIEVYKDKKLVLGFAPTRRRMYSEKPAIENRVRILGKVKALLAETGIELVDIDWLNEEGLLIDPEDVRKVEEHFRKAKVDAVFMPHCNCLLSTRMGKLPFVSAYPIKRLRAGAS